MYIIQDYNPVSTLNFVFCREMMRIIIRSSINLHKTSITALDGLQVWSIPIGRECSIATATNNPCKYPSGEATGSQSDGRLDVNCQFYFHHSKCAKKKRSARTGTGGVCRIGSGSDPRDKTSLFMMVILDPPEGFTSCDKRRERVLYQGVSRRV